jgi:hypothetical protein
VTEPVEQAPAGWLGAFQYCPLCGTAVPPGVTRCPACNFYSIAPPRPHRDTILRLTAYCVGLWVVALLLVLAFR